MSYEPTKWQTGDIITLNKLNKLEQGVAAMMEEYDPTVWQIGDTVTSTKLNKLEQAVATLSENNSGSGGGGSELGQGYTISNLSAQVAVYATRPDNLQTPPNIMFMPKGVSYPTTLPAGTYVCILDDGVNSIRVFAEDYETEIETETRESGGVTLCCFVMPEKNVVISDGYQ